MYRPLVALFVLVLMAATPASLKAEPQAARGDANNDGVVTLADALYLHQYLFGKGPAPAPNLDAGDANCDSRVDFLDAIYLVNYAVRGGPAPKCPAGSVSGLR
jgi:hypothetical protein